MQFIKSLYFGILFAMKGHRQELTEEERKVREWFIDHLLDVEPKADQCVIAMIGLVGSGKTSVAREFAKILGGHLVCADEIRVELRRRGLKYDHLREIVFDIVAEILNRDGNVVVDSDFIEQVKRTRILQIARRYHAPVHFVQAVCNYDIAVGRIMSGVYSENDLFGGAETNWAQKDASFRGVIVKLREQHRRTPLHYRWLKVGGGQWKERKLPFRLLARIDTTNEDAWRREVSAVSQKLLD